MSKQTRALNRKLALVVSFLLLVAVIATTLALRSTSTDYPRGSALSPVSITVTNGEYGSRIAFDLQKYGVVKSAKRFISELSSSGKANLIQPGSHLVQRHIPATLAISQMLDTSRISGRITVLPGSTFSDFLQQLHNAKIPTNNLGEITPPIPNSGQSLEGQLGLASYVFSASSDVNTDVVQALTVFKSTSLPQLHGFGPYSAYQVLTIASLLQIEGDPADYKKVARVIYNRLKISMPLQLNSTVQYATSTRGKINIGNSVTSVSSPYNTYLNQGLPPTPISNPSIAAIVAAQHPAHGNWLYFITVAPHDTRFTNTYFQFLVWKRIYEENLRAGKFK